jgi:hypothetical protein
MSKRYPCYNYETLARILLKKKRKGMDINALLDVFDHLDECSICREAIYHISREIDSTLLTRCEEDSEMRHSRHLEDSNRGD